ncbi:carboxypeptidase-like regulatory domain-containing protein [Marivirga arenosa]|uniref:Carboxypeptidase-like protein n=1 Tax=Marivirga arenosa TaxID=3059076 RepID=A0AA52EX55_9BACT|nr:MULTISPECIES: carboxypeptidase-like regulatory domain-containing protein [unclassified Marivirga]WKK85267.2 hypothetical protein QYS48_25480 [Marivirga sp. ABR2-2]WNB17376.1 hypothetical protein QYS47_33725 [Marivirga sp. BKB1-2]
MRLSLLFILLFSFSTAITAQDHNGIVLSESGEAISGAHIVNISANIMAISTDVGEFKLAVNKGDTLVVSNINYNTKQLIVGDQKYLKIVLSEANIQLDEVRVSNMPETESDFRRKIVDMGVVEDDAFVPYGMKPNKPMSKIPKNYDPSYTNSLGYAINKPISFIVKKLSKSHKEKLKYYQTVANQGNAIQNSKKYNSGLVQDLTGLKGDELTDFIQYLDLDEAFVQRSSDYEIASRILEEFEKYKTLKG